MGKVASPAIDIISDSGDIAEEAAEGATKYFGLEGTTIVWVVAFVALVVVIFLLLVGYIIYTQKFRPAGVQQPPPKDPAQNMIVPEEQKSDTIDLVAIKLTKEEHGSLANPKEFATKVKDFASNLFKSTPKYVKQSVEELKNGMDEDNQLSADINKALKEQEDELEESEEEEEEEESVYDHGNDDIQRDSSDDSGEEDEEEVDDE